MSERKTVWTAVELLSHDFGPVPWLVPGLITTGLTLLVGAPKLGKSWFALAISYAVSVGGAVLSKIAVPEHDVLVLALEDVPRRLKDRLLKIGATASPRLHLATEWTQGTEGIEWLEKWMANHPETKLVIIDTWARFTAVRDANDYHQVSAAAAHLKRFADNHDVAVVVVHHAKKGVSEDFLQAVLGSTGLAGAADTTMVLQRGRGNREATLSVVGRDVEETELVVGFDADTGTWALRGTVKEIQETDARQEIMDLLREQSEGMTPKAVANALKKNHNTVKQLMWKMQIDGVLRSLSGVYQVIEDQITVNRVNRKPENNPDSVYGFTEFTVIQGGQPPEDDQYPF